MTAKAEVRLDRINRVGNLCMRFPAMQDRKSQVQTFGYL
jgi:hypothetical protein